MAYGRGNYPIPASDYERFILQGFAQWRRRLYDPTPLSADERDDLIAWLNASEQDFLELGPHLDA